MKYRDGKLTFQPRKRHWLTLLSIIAILSWGTLLIDLSDYPVLNVLSLILLGATTLLTVKYL